MGFREIKHLWEHSYPKGTTQRFKDLDAYDKMLDGTFYDIIGNSFEKERNGDQDVPLYERRPNVQYSMPQMLAHQQASLLFGDKHRPNVRVYNPKEASKSDPKDQDTQVIIDALQEQLQLDEIMLEAVVVGQSGSVALVLSILDDGLPYIDVWPGKKCVPIYDPTNPRRMMALVREYSISGEELALTGYEIAKEQTSSTFWLRVVLDSDEEVWHDPMTDELHDKLGEKDATQPGGVVAWHKDKTRSRNHPFRQVPVIWIRNLNERRKVDGKSTFASIVDIQVALDYLASQITRGFHYTADPLLAVQRGELDSLIPAGGSVMEETPDIEAPVSIHMENKSPARVISIPHGAKAELLEIAGTGLISARDWFVTLREAALEVLSGSKAMSEKTGTGNPHSGKALEIMQQALVWLIERQRIAYGEHGFVPLIRMLLSAYKNNIFELEGLSGTVNTEIPVKLIWPSWMTPTGSDLLTTIQALQMAAGGSPQAPRQIAPMDLIVRQTIIALGYPDPSPNIQETIAEAEALEGDRHDKEVEIKKSGPPKTPAKAGSEAATSAA